MDLTNEELILILNRSFDENYWYSQIGLLSSDQSIDLEHRIDTNFYVNGKEYFNSLVEKLKELLCDKNNLKPKPNVILLIESEEKYLVLHIFAVLTGLLDLDRLLIISIISIIIRQGLTKFCSIP
jgi:hypothetical protein